MKILSLKLKNLASIAGEVEIDFTQDPLRSAGLIAITGPTGAGKSTILDAISLALYNHMPRLVNQTEQSVKLDDKYSDEKIAQNDSRHILRKGAVEGFAEVCFLGMDQKKYLVHWGVRRSRGKLTGKLQSVTRWLKCLDGGEVLKAEKSQVDKMVPSLTGLAFSQFSRAVLLAQSEVGALIKGREDERANILEYLTHSEIFREIGAVAYEKTAQYKNNYEKKLEENKNLENKLLTPEQIEALNEQIAEYDKRIRENQDECKKIEKEIEKISQYHRLKEELANKEEEYQQLLQQEADIKQDSIKYEDYQSFAEIKPIVLQKQDQVVEKKNLEEEYQEVQTEYENQQQKDRALQSQKSDMQRKLQQHQEFLRDIKDELEQAHQVENNYQSGQENIAKKSKDYQEFIENQWKPHQQEITNTINDITGKKQFLQQLSDSLNLLKYPVSKDNIKVALSALDNVKSQYEILQGLLTKNPSAADRLSDLRAQILRVIAKYEEDDKYVVQQYGGLDNFRKKVDEADRLCNTIDEIKQLLSQFNELSGKILNNDKEIDKDRVKRVEIQQSIERQEKEVSKQQQHLNSLDEILQQQRLLSTQNVKKLREQLQKDQPCMVCGSKHHPYVAEKERFEEHLLNLQEEQYNQAKQSFELLQKQLQDLQMRDENLRVKIEGNENGLQQHLKEQYQSMQGQLHQKWVNIRNNDEVLMPEMSWEDVFTDLQKICQDDHLAKQNLEIYRDQLNKYEKSHRTKEDAKNVDRQIDQLCNVVESLIKYFPNVDVEQTWYQNLGETLIEYFDSVQEQNKIIPMYDEADKNLKEGENHLASLKQVELILAKNKSESEQEINQQKQDNQKYEAQIKQFLQKYDVQSEITTVKAWNTYLEDQEQELRQKERNVFESMQQLQASMQEIGNKKTQTETKINSLTTSILHNEKQIESWFGKNERITMQSVTDWLSGDVKAEMDRLKQKIDHYQQNKNLLQGAIQSLSEERDKYSTENLMDMAELQKSLSDKNDVKKQLEQEREAFNFKLMQAEEFSKEYQQKYDEFLALENNLRRWEKISTVIGDKKGDKFKKIAQQYYLDILLQFTNRILSEFNKRYQLKRVPDSLSLLVVDNDMDSEERSVLSLSGGENFLVSLAFALAIGEMAAGQVKLESLFIDEGFGTLDQDSLNIVMDALDQLQDQGRKVILISHIREIQERIPVKIKVEMQGTGRSAISIES